MNRAKGWKEFWKEEDGMGTIEVVLITVVLVGLVLIFRTQLTSIVNSLFTKITNNTNRF
ncbi:MAG: hypothetical protein IKL04_00265 [Lachnospiraceae bacterium]|nr:hypothetical protein [Lachnospiraceae bacterium]